MFQAPRSAFRLSATRRPWTRRSDGTIPSGEYPSKRFPPRQPLTSRHRAFSLRSLLRSPVGVPSRRSLLVRSRVATARYSQSRPQGFVPPRSPLRLRSVSAAHRSMLPWAFESTRSDAAARLGAVQTSWTFRLASEPAWRPRTRTVVGKAKCFGFVWLHAPDDRSPCPKAGGRWFRLVGNPKAAAVSGPALSHLRRDARGIGRVWLRRIPKEAPRPHPVEPRRVRGMPMARPRREDPPRRPVAPEGARFQRNRVVSPEGISSRSSARPRRGAPVVRARLSILPRSPAYLWRACSPPTSDARRRGRPRATRTRVPKDAVSNPSLGPPKESQWKGVPLGHPKVIRLRRVAPADSSELECRSRARQTSS